MAPKWKWARHKTKSIHAYGRQVTHTKTRCGLACRAKFRILLCSDFHYGGTNTGDPAMLSIIAQTDRYTVMFTDKLENGMVASINAYMDVTFQQ